LFNESKERYNNYLIQIKKVLYFNYNYLNNLKIKYKIESCIFTSSGGLRTFWRYLLTTSSEVLPAQMKENVQSNMDLEKDKDGT